MIPVVDIRDLHVRFHGAGDVDAVNGVDITLGAGEVLDLLCESGSGKSVTLRALLRMLPPRHSNAGWLDSAIPFRDCHTLGWARSLHANNLSTARAEITTACIRLCGLKPARQHGAGDHCRSRSTTTTPYSAAALASHSQKATAELRKIANS
jgi:ABC-type dipeptide/oligopeptide/nickel transport system ATPase component